MSNELFALQQTNYALERRVNQMQRELALTTAVLCRLRKALLKASMERSEDFGVGLQHCAMTLEPLEVDE